ncbi:MAG TPA: hypothetical protein VGO91_18285 [Pyrinomonadaceae bacterium]|jgi:hypothetical protein|nr:hypothetical protein [Pyrinomonadaceae bacterium]
MAVEEINIPFHRQGTFLSLRLLGACGMIGAPMMLVEGLYRYLAHMADNQNNQIDGVLGLIYIGGWMCSAIGMRRLRVTGSGIWGMSVSAVQMVGLLLAGLWSMQEIVHFNALAGSELFSITDAAWPLSHLFMLVVGGFVLGAGVWHGWRRVPAFLCGLALLAFFIASAVGVREVGLVLFPVMTMIGFMSLGYAVRTSR